MFAIYIGALVIGLGILAVQNLTGHDHEVDHDVGGGDHEGHDDGDHDGTPLAALMSIRFWAFALLAFGLVGTLITFFGLGGVALTLVVSIVFALISGFVASTIIRRLMTRDATSVVTKADVVGMVGRVMVPPGDSGRLKVRIVVKGTQVDYVARTKEKLGRDEAVIVEEMEGDEIVVSAAPKELKP